MLVFVYGTLTDPERAEAVFGRASGVGGPTPGEGIEYEYLEEATVEGLRRIEGEYPTLVPGGSVEGRLLRTTPRGIERLDAYEGVDRGLYVRVPIPRESGGRVRTYVGDPDRLEVNADWPGEGPFRDRVLATVDGGVTLHES
ncbi:gamma-glutamylcyclotransferase family protein [Saliphagus infecundisoli]|uniref:Gamma-glutamylcyclotransferase n=1 Tax=Saliphagus infecundisoli TaxID=1849069 RepID=A0ABD5QES3_9EURY|nr:gamma-glutamylcyclotransferase family protein [Saliphagus infecundisoli]